MDQPKSFLNITLIIPKIDIIRLAKYENLKITFRYKEKKMLDFGNLMTAMVTPFDQNLEVDYKTMQTLALKLVENHTTGLVVCGTTGESPTLSKEEKINIVK